MASKRRRNGAKRAAPVHHSRYADAKRPQAELDFHDYGVLSSGEVRAMLLEFLAESRAAGRSKIRVITGRGLHSKARPVVRPQVARTLEAEHEAGRIEGFETERIDAGGDGAFFVRL